MLKLRKEKLHNYKKAGQEGKANYKKVLQVVWRIYTTQRGEVNGKDMKGYKMVASYIKKASSSTRLERGTPNPKVAGSNPAWPT